MLFRCTRINNLKYDQKNWDYKKYTWKVSHIQFGFTQ
jgi:hypothetical protein